MKILVTGAAGFVGAKMAYELSRRGDIVVGIDNINDYYDVRLKYGRLAECGICREADETDLPFDRSVQSALFPHYKFIRMGIENREAMELLFRSERFDKVVHLAAQAGVRYSIENPYAYMTSNMDGFMNILECCRHFEVKYLLFASSSSVYGLNQEVPFRESDKVDTPVSLYAASKRANELMAHAYSKLYGLPAVAVRFFSVYGPWGRPDMAPMLFARSILQGDPIKVFNHGNLSRDFTYIDDIVAGSIALLEKIPQSENLPNGVPFDIYNIGCSHPVKLMDFIEEIERAVGRTADKVFMDMQPGDAYHNYADTTKLEAAVGFKPQVQLHEGIARFIEWYQSALNPLR